MACQAAFLIYPFAPISRGGRGDYRPKVMAEAARTGRPIEQVAEEVRLMSHSVATGVDPQAFFRFYSDPLMRL